MGIHFDTLEFVKTLTASGVAAPHAEAIARAHAKSMGDLVGNDLATKSDLKVLRAEIKSELDGLRSEIKAQLVSQRSEFKADNDSLRSELKADNASLRSELKSEISSLRSELKADFQTELRSLKYAASIAMAFLSIVVVMSRFIH